VRPLALVQVEVGEVHFHVLVCIAAGCRRPRGPCHQRPFDTFMAAQSGGHFACSSAPAPTTHRRCDTVLRSNSGRKRRSSSGRGCRLGVGPHEPIQTFLKDFFKDEP
jgi:hypothetical protein